MILPLNSGNALRLWLQPPVNTLRTRVLRNLTGAFADQNDPAATVIFEGQDIDVIDVDGLKNGIEYFYQAFYFDGADWSASNVSSATPEATYQDASTDVLTLVRDRLQAGIDVEVSRGTLKPKSEKLPVLNAPPVYDQDPLPVISVHVDRDGSGQWSIGGDMSSDFNTGDGIDVDEGYFSEWALTIIGWSLNPDERISLRQAIKRILLANLPVFSAYGMQQIDLSYSDAEDFEKFVVPMYQIVGKLTCVAPSQITESVAPIADVTVEVTAIDAVIGA